MGKILWAILVMTLLVPHFFQETRAEDQAGQFKQNALQQNIAIDDLPEVQ